MKIVAVQKGQRSRHRRRHGPVDPHRARPLPSQFPGQSEKVKNADCITYELVHGLRIGALASIFDVETAPFVRDYSLLAEACHVVANIRIRNMATVGGNLTHADYRSDPAAALIALDTELELTGATGQRQVKLSDFLVGPYETAIREAELASSVLVPPPPRSSFPRNKSREPERDWAC